MTKLIAIAFSILMIALLTSVEVNADCGNLPGKFEIAGGSEYSIELMISKNKIQLIHSTWLPTQYENRSTNNYSGTITCNRMNIKAQFSGELVEAELGTVGKNPLGLNESGIVIKFGDVVPTKFKFLRNVLLLESASLGN